MVDQPEVVEVAGPIRRPIPTVLEQPPHLLGCVAVGADDLAPVEVEEGRSQVAFVDDKEIERLVDAVATDTPNYDNELLNLKTRDQQGEGGSLGEILRDRGGAGEEERQRECDRAHHGPTARL